jgi:hypothetical protein
MRNRIFYLVLLVVTIGTGLFCLDQVLFYFTKREIVLGHWDKDGLSEVGMMTEGGEKPIAQVQGLSVSQSYLNSTKTQRVTFYSFQAYLFDKYLQQIDSPLAGFGKDFVNACRKYDTPKDCTLLLAIAKVETNYCKAGLSLEQKNCWGFGGSGPNRIIYKNFEESIDEVTRRVKEGYTNRFFEDPNYGALSYCGSHCTSWASHVQSERYRIKAFFEENGYSNLF